MVHIWRFWLWRRWRALSMAVLVALVVVGAVWLMTGRASIGITMLGDRAAPRPAAAGHQEMAVLPRSTDPDDAPGTLPNPNASLLDMTPPPNVGPQTVAAAQAAWSPDELARRQDTLVGAINCARAAQGRPPLRVDPALSQTAGAAWLTLVHHRDWSLLDLPGHYALRSVVALDAGTSQPAGCGVDGLDATALRTAADATTIGVAIFPPQASWDSPSAVVLIR